MGENKLFQFDVMVEGSVSGVCEAPDLETAKEWIRDEYSFGDLETDSLRIDTHEVPISLKALFPRIDVGPES